MARKTQNGRFRVSGRDDTYQTEGHAVSAAQYRATVCAAPDTWFVSDAVTGERLYAVSRDEHGVILTVEAVA